MVLHTPPQQTLTWLSVRSCVSHHRVRQLRIQVVEERISVVEDSLEDIQSLTKENLKSNKSLTQNIQEIWDTVKRLNLRIIGIEEGEEIQLKGRENIFNRIIKENFPNLQKDMPMKVQEAYRTPNRLDHKKKSL